MLDFKQNFFTSAKPAQTMPEIAWVNDPKYRRNYGMWLYENFDSLTHEYKTYGRFLSLHEIQDTDSPLDLT
jgi:hypothetical protein